MSDNAGRVTELNQPMVSPEPYPVAGTPQQQMPEYPEKPRAQDPYPGPPQQGYYPQQGYPTAPPQGYPYGQPYPAQGYPAAPPPYYPVEPNSQYPPQAAVPIAYNSYGPPSYAQPTPGVVAYGQPTQVQPVYVAAPVAQPLYNPNDTNISMIIFVAGFVCCPIWCGGFSYFRSANPRARLFARLSLGMLACCSVFFLIYLCTGVVAATRAATQSTSCDMQYNGRTCFGASATCRLCVKSSGVTCMTSSSTCLGTTYYSLSSYCASHNQFNCPTDCTTTSWGCTM